MNFRANTAYLALFFIVEQSSLNENRYIPSAGFEEKYASENAFYPQK